MSSDSRRQHPAATLGDILDAESDLAQSRAVRERFVALSIFFVGAAASVLLLSWAVRIWF